MGASGVYRIMLSSGDYEDESWDVPPGGSARMRHGPLAVKTNACFAEGIAEGASEGAAEGTAEGGAEGLAPFRELAPNL